jgi:hypothetical protein
LSLIADPSVVRFFHFAPESALVAVAQDIDTIHDAIYEHYLNDAHCWENPMGSGLSRTHDEILQINAPTQGSEVSASG